MKRFLLFLTALVVGLSAVALAQIPDWDPSHLPLMGGNIAYMAGAVVALVHVLRRSLPVIDGPVVVPAFAVATGAVTGLAWQWLGLLTAEPFAALPLPAGGLVYGVVAAAAGVLGLNLIEKGIELIAKYFPGRKPETSDPDLPPANRG